MARTTPPTPRKRESRPRPSEVMERLYDRWQIPTGEDPDAPLVTMLHDGADWVEMHAPRSFFQELQRQLEQGQLNNIEKWLMVLSMARKEPDPKLCAAPTKRGNPCHMETPCRHHPKRRN